VSCIRPIRGSYRRAETVDQPGGCRVGNFQFMSSEAKKGPHKVCLGRELRGRSSAKGLASLGGDCVAAGRSGITPGGEKGVEGGSSNPEGKMLHVNHVGGAQTIHTGLAAGGIKVGKKSNRKIFAPFGRCGQKVGRKGKKKLDRDEFNARSQLEQKIGKGQGKPALWPLLGRRGGKNYHERAS